MPILLSLLAPLLGKVVDTVGSKLGVNMDSPELQAKKIELELEVQKIISTADVKQLEINLAEAANTSRKWPTWREMLGYICAAAIGYHFVIQQFLAFALSAGGLSVVLPALDMTGIMTILSAMLGVHFIDSRYNSPLGIMPNVDEAAVTGPDKRKGHLVNDPEAGGVVWRDD